MTTPKTDPPEWAGAPSPAALLRAHARRLREQGLPAIADACEAGADALEPRTQRRAA